LQVVGDSVVGCHLVGQTDSVEQEQEDLFEEGGVGVFVGPAEGNGHVQALVVAVLDAVAEGVVQAALAPHWVHLDAAHPERPLAPVHRHQLEAHAQARVGVGELERLEGKEVSLGVVGVGAADLVAIVRVILGQHEQVVEVDL